MIVDNTKIFGEVEAAFSGIVDRMSESALMEMFTRDFSLRFCWSSNAIEGNTLSLDETVALIEYDEVGAGKPYSHYQEAKFLHCAISESMLPFHHEMITASWIKKNNGIIMGTVGEYRTGVVYVGSLVEVVYTPPAAEQVPELMEKYLQAVNFTAADIPEIMEKVAKSHFDFERIHPFKDGNGRVGRMILNQQLINHGLLPVAIGPKSDYRRSFVQYDKNGDMSKLIHEICKEELASIQRLQALVRQAEQPFQLNPPLDQLIAEAQKKTAQPQAHQTPKKRGERS